MKKIWKILILSILIFSVFIILALFDVPLAYNIYTKRDYVSTSIGIGTSMTPFIKNGDTIVILHSDYPSFALEVGEVLVFYDGDGFIAHRIYKIDNNRFFVKGDNNPDVDIYFVSDVQVVGKVIGVIDRYNVASMYLVDKILE